MPAINPDILTWARETAGFSLEEAAQAISLQSAHGKTGAERLFDLEQGKGDPSRPLLRRMALKYRRSLLIFYLDRAPRQGDRGQDFRIAPGTQPPEYDPTLDALLRDISTRHALVKSVLEDDESPSLKFVASARMTNSQAVAKSITETLGFDLGQFRDQETIENAFGYLRSKIENAGIFLLLIGNLGSHHTNIPAQTFRGFAIADPIAPFVIINDQDARSAWSFTALHEVTHLWLGTTGISGSSAEARIEQFCNEVAGAMLLQPGELAELADITHASFDRAIEQIAAFAQARNISRAMVAYNLLVADLIDRRTWRQLRDRFYQDWQDTRSRTREKQKSTDGGPRYYVVRRHRLGSALLNLVDRSLDDGLLTHTKAGQVLGVKPRNVAPLLRGSP